MAQYTAKDAARAVNALLSRVGLVRYRLGPPFMAVWCNWLDTTDSKSVAEMLVGSSPTSATILLPYGGKRILLS